MLNNPEILFVEVFVGMAKTVAWWHEYALGFDFKGKRETKGQYGMQITYWMQRGDANILITSALDPAAHDVVSFIDMHGNSIKRFAVEVQDIESTLTMLKEKDVILLSQGIEWEEQSDEQCGIVRCKLFDNNEISFIQRVKCKGPLPGFHGAKKPQENSQKPNKGNIIRYDHLASVVRINEADYWSKYLTRLFSLKHIQTIGEEFFAGLSTGMKMHVLSSENNGFNKVVVEPLAGKDNKSQVDIFLEHHFGNGIQHIAFEVDDLVMVVHDFREKGVQFTNVPPKYYEELERVNPDLPIQEMRRANILCEKEGDKLLLQVFTEPIGDRPTLFYEFIQRINGFNGFGANNIKELFKSLELHQNGRN